MVQDSMPEQESDAGGVQVGTTALVNSNPIDQKETDFVLAEVRKQLEPNPETAVVELKLDPDYKGADGSYLVNVVLDTHGRKIMLGVVVSVQHNSEGRQATMGYID
jgi:hypothetical protein